MPKLKTGLLVCLVIISILLAAALMTGKPTPAPGKQPEDIWFGSTPELHEVSIPNRIYLINAQGEIGLVETFSQMYLDLLMTFSQIQYRSARGGDVWTPGKYPTDTFPPGVLFRYDYQISRELLASWLTMFYDTDFPFASVDSIFVPLTPGPVQFINSTTQEVWQLNAALSWNVFERAVSEPEDVLGYRWAAMQSGDGYTAVPGVYELLRSEVLVVPGWTPEEINYNAVIRSFYLEPVLIQEPDGTEIYTDGLQALRIFPSGSLAYTVAPSLDGSAMPGQPGVMKTALSFLAAHGGWPGNTLPTYLGIEQAGDIRVEFTGYALGLPIFGTNTGIAIESNGARVSQYTRDLVWARPDVAVEYAEIKPLSWHFRDSETQAAKYFASVEAEIYDVALAYYWQQDQLIPVWKIWVGRQIIFVGAVDGRVINIRTPSGGK